MWQNRKDFLIETARSNLQRMKMTAALFLLLQFFLALLFFFLKRDGLSEFPNSFFLALFGITALFLPLFFIYCVFLGKKLGKNLKRIRAATVWYSIVILSWGAFFSYLDQFRHGQITVYLAVIMLVAFVFNQPTKTIALITGIPQIAFLLLLFFAGPPNMAADLRLENAVVSTAVILIAVLMDRRKYADCLEDYRKRCVIEEKNRELRRMNKEILEANVELTKRSVTDSLTGLHNRRMFEEVINKEWDRCKRYSISLSVIMMDVDHFKPYNDYYGHQEGDYCLQKIGALLMKTVRFSSDIVARYGGEEFIVALPYTDKEKAAMLAERIRSEVESLCIAHETSEVSDHVTISVGVSTTVPADGTSAEELIYAADMALYEAKSQSRNCIVAVEL